MKNKIRMLWVTTLTAVVATAAVANSLESWGPRLGSEIPDQLEALDQDGHQQSFDSLVGEKGLVIIFLRSLDWCRFCKKQAREIHERTKDFNQRGLHVVVLSYDSVETLRSFRDKYAPGLTLVSDPESRVIKAFGILNQREKPGTRGYGIPNPGIMIVDSSGIIRAKFAEKGYRNRPQVDTVLDAIDQLGL